MSNIKRFDEFVNEKKTSKEEIYKQYKELKQKGLKELNKQHKKSGKEGSIGMSDVHDGNIIDALKGKDKTEFKRLSKETDKLMGFKVKENLEFDKDNELYLIAREIEDGNTNGEIMNGDKLLKWDLEVNLKDWIKLDDEDVDYIAAQIRSGNTEGNDPIDWSLDFGGDSFDIEEEEEITRKDIANQIDIDEEDFEDSDDLGDMADSIIQNHETYEYTLSEVEDLFDAYLDNNDVSRFFNTTLGKDFEYDRYKSLYNDIIKYYAIFEEEFGYLEEFNSDMFKNILKNKIKEFLDR